jgi:hypothetical protein
MFKRAAQSETRRRRAERKAERGLELQRIKDMEALGYEVTSTGSDGRVTFKKRGADEHGENVTEFGDWLRKRNARSA